MRRADSVAILDRAAEGGIDFLDTADVYPARRGPEHPRRTEEILGRWLQGQAGPFMVATKCFAPTGPAPFDRGNSRKHILAAVEASLRRLQTDYIDLYQLHGYDPETPIDETLGALDDLVHQGKVRYIGCSNFLAYQLVRASAGARRWAWPASTPSSPATTCCSARSSARCCRSAARRASASFPTTRSPAACCPASTPGPRRPPEGTRFTLGTAAGIYQDRYWHDREFDTVDELRQLAGQAGVSLVTLAVAWVLANPAVTAPIIGASRPDQLDASLAPPNSHSTTTSSSSSTSSPTSTAWATRPGSLWDQRRRGAGPD